MNPFLKWFLWLTTAAVVILGVNYAYGYWVWSRANPGQPDLSRVIVYEGRPRGIFVSRLDGNDKKEITTSLNLGADDFTWLPRFSPDGGKVAFATGHLNRGSSLRWTIRLMVADLPTGGIKELFHEDIDANSEDDLPFLAEFYISWSLDGRTINFAVESVSSEEGRTVGVETGEVVPRYSEEERQPTFFVEQPGAPDSGSLKWRTEQTYFRSGEFGSFGENAIFVRPRYSLFRKKILSEYSYHNGVWLDEDHLIVDGPRDIIVVDIKGRVKARIPDTRHFDLAP